MKIKVVVAAIPAVVVILYALALFQLPALFLATLYFACVFFCSCFFFWGIYFLKRVASRRSALHPSPKQFAVVVVVGLIALLLFSMALPFSGGTAEVRTSSLEELRAFPYLNWVRVGKDQKKTGVIRHNPEMSANGLNLYHSRFRLEVYLMDMDGNRLRTWSAKSKQRGWLQHVELDRKGNLFAIFEDGALVKLRRNFQIKWIKNPRLRYHHDLAIAKNGDIYALSRRDEIVFFHWFPIPILNDVIIVLSPSGQIKDEISVYETLRKKDLSMNWIGIYSEVLRPTSLWNLADRKLKKWNRYIFDTDTPLEPFHVNSIEILDQDIKGFCRKGDLLLSVRELDVVVVVDPREREVTWSWSPGLLSRQHNVLLLKNGNLLLFDNSPYRGYSRVLELDPITKRIAWQYGALPQERFFSERRGGNQRLPNGNTLITESDRARVFEVTPKGEIVWEFINPESLDDKRAPIYRMTRITEPALVGLFTRIVR